MSKRKYKNVYITLVIIVLIVTLVMIFQGRTQQAVYQQIGGEYRVWEPEVKNINFNGVPMTLTSQYFGDLSQNTENLMLCEGTCSPPKNIINSYSSSGDTLSMESKALNVQSYLYVEGAFPAGTLKVTCTTNTPQDVQEVVSASCKVINYKTIETNANPVGSELFKDSLGKIETFSIVLDSPKTLNFELYTRGGRGVYATSRMEIEFTPDVIVLEKETYYRFLNNQCSEITILPSEKTSNDYNTIQQCEDKIAIEPNEIIVYRLENNLCKTHTILEEDKLNSDYNSLNDCKKDVIEDDEDTEEIITKSITEKILIFIIFGVFLIILITIIILAIRRKRK